MLTWITRRQRSLSILALFCSLACFTRTAEADLVVLRTGSELRGTVANRELVASAPDSYSHISILVEQEIQNSGLQRLDVVDIQYVVLEDGSTKRVIEFSGNTSQMPRPRTGLEKYEKPILDRDPPDGVLVAAVGVGVAMVGALFKFGEAKATITGSSINVAENSYNGLNYGLMVAGGILVVVGITIESSRSSDALSSGAYLQMDGFRKVTLAYGIRY